MYLRKVLIKLPDEVETVLIYSKWDVNPAFSIILKDVYRATNSYEKFKVYKM